MAKELLYFFAAPCSYCPLQCPYLLYCLLFRCECHVCVHIADAQMQNEVASFGRWLLTN